MQSREEKEYIPPEKSDEEIKQNVNVLAERLDELLKKQRRERLKAEELEKAINDYWDGIAPETTFSKMMKHSGPISFKIPVGEIETSLTVKEYGIESVPEFDLKVHVRTGRSYRVQGEVNEVQVNEVNEVQVREVREAMVRAMVEWLDDLMEKLWEWEIKW